MENTLLGLLYEGPRHGYDLAAHFARGGDLYAVVKLGKSQLYSLLKAIEAGGLARASREETKDAPARKVFRLTPLGRGRFEEWVRRPAESVKGLRVEFLLKVYLLGRLNLGGQPELMDAQAKVLSSRLDELKGGGEGQGIGPWVRALQVGLLEAGISWLSEWRAKAPSLAKEGERPLASGKTPRPGGNVLGARVVGFAREGAIARVDLETAPGTLTALMASEAVEWAAFYPGQEVELSLPPGCITLLDGAKAVK